MSILTMTSRKISWLATVRLPRIPKIYLGQLILDAVDAKAQAQATAYMVAIGMHQSNGGARSRKEQDY